MDHHKSKGDLRREWNATHPNPLRFVGCRREREMLRLSLAGRK